MDHGGKAKNFFILRTVDTLCNNGNGTTVQSPFIQSKDIWFFCPATNETVTSQRFQVALAISSPIGSLQYTVMRYWLVPCAHAITRSGLDSSSLT